MLANSLFILFTSASLLLQFLNEKQWNTVSEQEEIIKHSFWTCRKDGANGEKSSLMTWRLMIVIMIVMVVVVVVKTTMREPYVWYEDCKPTHAIAPHGRHHGAGFLSASCLLWLYLWIDLFLAGGFNLGPPLWWSRNHEARSVQSWPCEPPQAPFPNYLYFEQFTLAIGWVRAFKPLFLLQVISVWRPFTRYSFVPTIKVEGIPQGNSTSHHVCCRVQIWFSGLVLKHWTNNLVQFLRCCDKHYESIFSLFSLPNCSSPSCPGLSTAGNPERGSCQRPALQLHLPPITSLQVHDWFLAT